MSTVTRYVVLFPFAGWKKGALLEELPDQFWVDKGYAAKIEMEASEMIEEHKPVHGRPKIPPSTEHTKKSEHSGPENIDD